MAPGPFPVRTASLVPSPAFVNAWRRQFSIADTEMIVPRTGGGFSADALPMPMLSSLLWAANGVNRPGHGRTAPSAINAQEIDIYVALPAGAYLYEATAHQLILVAGSDVRAVTGYQDFVDTAPLDLVFIADHSRMHLVPAAQRSAYAHVAAGAITQNVYLFCAANGLATVIRAWIDRDAISQALGLPHDRQVLLSQTVGSPQAAKTRS